MNTFFDRRLSFLLSLATLAQLTVGIAVLGNGLSAQAETIDTGSTDASPKLAVAATTPAPLPGTTATSAAPLTRAESLTSQLGEPASETAAPSVAQIDIDPGAPTIGGSSYIGVAGNIGLDGETALGDGNFMIISKVGLTSTISARPSVVLGDDAVFLIPVTYDFSLQPVDAFDEVLPIAPYIGGGVAFSTGDDSEVGLLLSGGVDFPLTAEFTATAGVNVGFLDETDIGLLIGVGYNFSGLGL